MPRLALLPLVGAGAGSRGGWDLLSLIIFPVVTLAHHEFSSVYKCPLFGVGAKERDAKVWREGMDRIGGNPGGRGGEQLCHSLGLS